MTGTPRIRWEPTAWTGHKGYAGTLDKHLFALWQSPSDSGDIIQGEWVLTTHLPVPHGWRTPHGHDPGALKAEAERRLEEFARSLGAVFPEPPATDPDCEECGFGLPRHDKDCSHYPVAAPAAREKEN
jgi:hypothetical protein